MTKLPRPLHDRVIVRRFEEVEAPSGGIIVPDAAKEKPLRGTVLTVGLGLRNAEGVRMPLDVLVDDTILFGKYSGTEIKIDGEDLLIMREEEIMAVDTKPTNMDLFINQTDK